jgi:hypothetical protein
MLRCINHKCYGDGTEINTEEGKLFLDSVLDVASRRIVGFDVVAPRHRLRLRVLWPWRSRSFCTDQGSEYTGHRFRTACQRIGIQQSMGRAGSALDNAVIESWHSTLEFELRSLRHFATRAEARTAVATWIDDYNRHRRHSALQMKCPVDFELGPQAAGAASRRDMMPPSSPAPRPSPSGGLRPALTPAAGGAAQRQSGPGRFKIKSQQIRSLRFQGIAGTYCLTAWRLPTASSTSTSYSVSEFLTSISILPTRCGNCSVISRI